jgi:hypothetical protein
VTLKILLSFVGNNDPYGYKSEELGPILSILKKRNFDKLFLFFNSEKYWDSLIETQAYCNQHYPAMKVDYRLVEALNPTDHNIVYPAMYKVVRKIVEDNPQARFTISITSGTPTMHACWILLQQGGVIKADLIQVSLELGITQVKFNLDDFPKIEATEDIKVEMTRLARENELMKQSLDLDNSLKNGFFIPEEGIDIDNEILPAYYKGALKRTNNNASKAARLLKLHPHTFRKRLRVLEKIK